MKLLKIARWSAKILKCLPYLQEVDGCLFLELSLLHSTNDSEEEVVWDVFYDAVALLFVWRRLKF